MTKVVKRYSFIYLLKHPITGDVFYVGQSVNPNKRLREHICGVKTVCDRYIKTLASAPILDIVGRFSAVKIVKKEQLFINTYSPAFNNKKACVSGKGYYNPVECISTGIVYESYSDAGRAYGVCSSTIRNWCAKNYLFKKV
jgi:hypothetical protein